MSTNNIPPSPFPKNTDSRTGIADSGNLYHFPPAGVEQSANGISFWQQKPGAVSARSFSKKACAAAKLISWRLKGHGGTRVDDSSLDPMHPDAIAHLDSLMRVVLWILDVTIYHPFDEDLYNRYFKNLEFRPEVFRIFELVREFVLDFLNREQNTLSKPKYNVRFINHDKNANDDDEMVLLGEVTSPIPRDSTDADILSYDVLLFPPLYAESFRFEQFNITRIEPTEHRDHAVGGGQEHVLLHELVHLVTGVRSPLRKSSCDDDGSFFIPAVRDARLADWAYKGCPDDKALVKKAAKDYKGIAYGYDNTHRLAALTHGHVGALQNADSYSLYALECAYKHLAHRLQPASDVELQLANTEMVSALKDRGRQVMEEVYLKLRADPDFELPDTIGRALLPTLSTASQETYADRQVRVRKVLQEIPVPVSSTQGKWFHEPPPELPDFDPSTARGLDRCVWLMKRAVGLGK